MVFSKFFHSNSGKSEEITPPKKPETFPEKKETCLKKAESFEFYSLFIIKFIDSCICRVLGSSETFSSIAIMKVKELPTKPAFRRSGWIFRDVAGASLSPLVEAGRRVAMANGERDAPLTSRKIHPDLRKAGFVGR